MQIRILSLDDKDRGTQAKLVRNLSSTMEIELSYTTEDALGKLRKAPFDVLLLDRHLGEGKKTGIELIPSLKYEFPSLAIIILTYDDNFSGIQKAFASGASDYVIKGDALISELQVRIPEAIKRIKTDQVFEIHQRENAGYDCPLVGASRFTSDANQLIRLRATSSEPLLIQASPWSGAREISHGLWTARQDPYRPFITVDLSTLGQDRFEEAIFGSTGQAGCAYKGALLLGSRGDVVLEGINLLPSKLQDRLCQALEKRLVTPIRSDISIPIDVRLIAISTHSQSREGVGLSKKLSSFLGSPFIIPPLSKRSDDIPQIATHYLNTQYQGAGYRLTKTALDFLSGQPWPGNFKQLTGVIDGAIQELLSQSSRTLDIYDIERAMVSYLAARRTKKTEVFTPDSLSELNPYTLSQSLSEAERGYLMAAIRLCSGDLKKVQDILKIPKASLYKRITRLGINKSEIKKVKHLIEKKRSIENASIEYK